MNELSCRHTEASDMELTTTQARVTSTESPAKRVSVEEGIMAQVHKKPAENALSFINNC